MQLFYFVPLRNAVQFAARLKYLKLLNILGMFLGISATPQQSWGPSG